MTKTIKLVSSDGQGIKVEEEVALRSKVIEDMLNDVDGILENCRKHGTANSSPLSPSSSAIVIASTVSSDDSFSSSIASSSVAASSDNSSSYCISLKSISNPTLNAWDREFIKLDSSSLYDLLIVCTEEEGQR
ncbi:SKP1-like protein 1 [Zingiber officinale]|uniref:SKP1-like protein 1 n=1 Tax=Zingiber officinale TaxID=94328 RepID=UPI001C4C350E|nr:SKP1-like protein 1 [Zingiber officinale]